jgi:hypothetical protein
MAKNRRKVYGLEAEAGEADGGIPCAECGCRHSYVIRTEKIGDTVRRKRICRNCGRTFYTTETT